MVIGSIARQTADSTRAARAKTPQHTGLFAFVLLILIWAPIPIGSNRVWSMALVQSGTLMLLGFWLVAYAWRPFEMPDACREGGPALPSPLRTLLDFTRTLW